QMIQKSFWRTSQPATLILPIPSAPLSCCKTLCKKAAKLCYWPLTTRLSLRRVIGFMKCEMAALPPASSAARGARFFEQRYNRRLHSAPTVQHRWSNRVGSWQHAASALRLAADGERAANLDRGSPRGVGRIVRGQLTRTFTSHFA